MVCVGVLVILVGHRAYGGGISFEGDRLSYDERTGVVEACGVLKSYAYSD